MANGTALETIEEHRCFGGVQGIYRHAARHTACDMRFGLYLPPQASAGKVPLLVWLSGLSCTEENFVIKAGAQRVAAELGLAILTPDTSPRGVRFDGDADAYDFGLGAGFYVDATQAPWSTHYRMYSYIADELLTFVGAYFAVDLARTGLFGHSMGGHGALTIGVRNPALFKSLSAFAPISSSTRCPWGEKALTGYLGPDRAAWQAYDASAVIEQHGWQGPPILVDQGTADGFLPTQLHPHLLQAACDKAGVPLQLRMQRFDGDEIGQQHPGADHREHDQRRTDRCLPGAPPRCCPTGRPETPAPRCLRHAPPT